MPYQRRRQCYGIKTTLIQHLVLIPYRIINEHRLLSIKHIPDTKLYIFKGLSLIITMIY